MYDLVFDTGQIERQVAALSGVLPAQTQELLSQELHSLVQASAGALGLTAIAGLLLALWSASRGMSGLLAAINIAYEENERRSFLKFNLIAIGLTVGVVIGGIVAIALVAVLPVAVQWPLLIVLVMLGLAVLYRFGPDREAAVAVGIPRRADGDEDWGSHQRPIGAANAQGFNRGIPADDGLARYLCRRHARRKHRLGQR
jgi:membrane protein